MHIIGKSNNHFLCLVRLHSNASARFSGRYPWAIEDVLRQYGDVVRIAPNELVFFTPQAFQGWGMPSISSELSLTLIRYILSTSQEPRDLS